MKKKLVAGLLTGAMIAALLTGCARVRILPEAFCIIGNAISYYTKKTASNKLFEAVILSIIAVPLNLT